MSIDLKIEALKKIAKEAGKIILEVYNEKSYFDSIENKTDDSPLTIADKRSHDYILAELKKIHPEIPVISEEGKEIPYETRKKWELFWLVDPLDGTKEFIKRNGQFTVNIALIEHNKTVFGVIYTPVTDKLYFTENGKAFVESASGRKELKVNHRKENLVAVRSSSHAAPEEEALFRAYGVKEYAARGSSLKFCMVAEGEADIYYRHKPTMEWDTAAGQAIVEAAGGKVYKDQGDDPFTYNKPSLVNSGFLCLGRD